MTRSTARPATRDTPRDADAADLLMRAHPGARAQLKRRLMAAALVCFNERGIPATTIEEILSRAEASVGNLYHHFGSKEGLVAALFFCALDDQSVLSQKALDQAHTAREGVAALVGAYVDWVSAQPDWARFVFAARAVVAAGPQAAELKERNRQRARALMAWLAEPGRVEAFQPWPAELMPSLLIGAAENYSRAWLSGRVKAAPTVHREVLIEAVWRAVKVADLA